jgi:hypothetical protein
MTTVITPNLLSNLFVAADNGVSTEKRSHKFDVRTDEQAEPSEQPNRLAEFGRILERLVESDESANGRHKNEKADDPNFKSAVR